MRISDWSSDVCSSDLLSTHPRNTGELLNNLAIAKLEQQQAISELDTLKDSVASDYLDVLDLLKVAQTHFHKYPNPSVCPLCESGDRVEGLTAEVDKRIHSLGLHRQMEAAQRAEIGRESGRERVCQYV